MPQGLSGGRDDKPEAGLQPVLNFFGNPVEILSRWYRATSPIAADYRRAIAREEFARGGGDCFELSLRCVPLKWNQFMRQSRSAPSPRAPGLPGSRLILRKSGKPDLRVREGWGGG